MNTEKSMMEKAMEFFFKAPAVEKSMSFDRIRFDFYDNNAVGYVLDGRTITKFFSAATVKDGRTITTKTAKRKKLDEAHTESGCVFTASYEENGLQLIQRFTVKLGDPYFIATASVSDVKGVPTESNYIAPLDFAYPDAQCDPLFLSLDQKMLLVPYDNDMWVRYESAPLRPGRTSYDVTAIYNELTNQGLVIGALDFFDWKNAIRCSQQDARCYTAFSGVADAGTHDIVPHGYLEGMEVTSARFMCGWYEDIRAGMERFGVLSMEDKPAFRWNHPVPFGWNSYSAGCMTLEQWEEAGKFIHDQLPNFCDEEKTTYINLDANFMLDKKKMRQIVDELHARGQKAGNYMAPLSALVGTEQFMPLKGSFGKTYQDIIMRDDKGELYPKIDSGRPVDITNPIAEKHTRATIREIVEMGFDYIKIDFLAHGSVEGKHFDPAVRTGRQALKRFYDILAEELDPAKVGRDIFVDLSIAPLFPGGFGHARRCCCDAFGHHEDVRYVLNALNFGWWQSGALYCYNDPDHTVLQKSMVDGRGYTDLNSARSRYNASLISGTVMLLSDNFGPIGPEEDIAKARDRVPAIANNDRLNAVARIGKPFVPAYLKSDTCNVYFLEHDGKRYVALFNFSAEQALVSVPAGDVRMPESGVAERLDDGTRFAYNGSIGVELDGYGSVILEIAAD